MENRSKRLCITLPMDVIRELERLKKRYYGESDSEIMRLLVKEGVSSLRAEDGNVYLHGEEPALRSYQPVLPAPVELPTDAITVPFGRIYVCEEEEEYDGGIRKVRVNKIVNEESYWTHGYLTTENILYVEHDSEILFFRLDGKIVKGRVPVVADGRYYIPVVMKGKGYVADTKEEAYALSTDAPYGFYFGCVTKRLYRYENGLLWALKSAERGL